MAKKSNYDKTVTGENKPDATLFSKQDMEGLVHQQAVASLVAEEEKEANTKKKPAKTVARKASKTVSKNLRQDPKNIPLELTDVHTEASSTHVTSGTGSESSQDAMAAAIIEKKMDGEMGAEHTIIPQEEPGVDQPSAEDALHEVENPVAVSLEALKQKVQENVSNDAAEQHIAFDPAMPIYLEIHRGNIYHYFSRAIVLPSRYYPNRAFSDLQSAYTDQLILSNNASNPDPEMVLLQVQLKSFQLSSLNVQGRFAFMDFPLAITSVKSVIVRSDAVKATILSDATLFDGGFIPQQLIAVGTVEISTADFNSLKLQKQGTDYSAKINKFNRTLGLLAFIRNYSYLTSSGTGLYKSVSDHFFLAMQALEPAFGSAILSNPSLSEFYSFLFEENCPDDKPLLKWLFSRLQIDENFNDRDVKDFMSALAAIKDESIPQERIREINGSLKDAIKRKSAIRLVEGIATKSTSILPLYIFSYLRNYAQQNNILIARRDIVSQYAVMYGEYAFGLLGYFYGYAALANSEERMASVSEAVSLSSNPKPRPEIKFKVDSEFDRSVIDIVFGYVFQTSLSRPDYIQGAFPAEETSTYADRQKEIIFRRSSIIGEKYESIRIKRLPSEFDTLIGQISAGEEWIGYHTELGFLCQKLSMLPEFSANAARRLVNHGLVDALKEMRFSRATLIERLKHPSMKIKIEELRIRILLAKENKEL